MLRRRAHQEAGRQQQHRPAERAVEDLEQPPEPKAQSELDRGFLVRYRKRGQQPRSEVPPPGAARRPSGISGDDGAPDRQPAHRAHGRIRQGNRAVVDVEGCQGHHRAGQVRREQAAGHPPRDVPDRRDPCQGDQDRVDHERALAVAEHRKDQRRRQGRPVAHGGDGVLHDAVRPQVAAVLVNRVSSLAIRNPALAERRCMAVGVNC